jgi:hypothetical protein
MAKTWDRFEPAARTAQQYMALLREARRLGRELVEYHTQNDFSDAVGSEYAAVDADGHLRGLHYTPANYVNTVVLAQNVEKLLTNQVPTQNNYVYTIEQVVKL